MTTHHQRMRRRCSGRLSSAVPRMAATILRFEIRNDAKVTVTKVSTTPRLYAMRRDLAVTCGSIVTPNSLEAKIELIM